MSLIIHHSNHLDILKEIIAHVMENEPNPNPFENEWCIVNSLGMANWVRLSLAERFDIFANIQLDFPKTGVAKLLTLLFDPEFSKNHPLVISKAQLAWAIYAILREVENHPPLKPLQCYLEANHHRRGYEAIIMSLANELAGLYDKYLAYRTDWLDHWKSGARLYKEDAVEEWQAYLWKVLEDRFLPETHFGNIVHKIPMLSSEHFSRPHIPKRIFMIGISSLPPMLIDILNALTEHIDIHVCFTNPSQYYWGDLNRYNADIPLSPVLQTEINTLPADIKEELWIESSGNPLLAAYGKIGRDFLNLLIQKNPHNEIEAFSEPETQGLLGEIQRAIFNLKPLSEDKRYRISPQDHSISIHQHYSVKREVEGLYDQLLHLFNHDSDLLPKDIVVMVSDIDRYRPMIEAVFNHPPTDAAYIPYSISDYSLTQSDAVLNAFLMLLSIDQSEFPVSTVLSFLNIPEIRTRFEIDEEDFERIQFWVNENQIHFGINAEHLAELNLRADEKNTWLWGLKRLLVGYSFPESVYFEETLTYPHVEGLNAITLGNFTDFIHALIQCKHILSENHPLEAWRQLLPSLWQQFFKEEEDDYPRFHFMESLWQHFIEDGISVGINEPVNIQLLYSFLREQLESERPQSRFLSGAVNFCTFLPMRAIPFKVVCLLGMNQADFPQSTPKRSFDLTQTYPRLGDRSRSSDDRYLFLEALLSSERYFYMSYIAKSIHDNSECFPSLVIDDLYRYISLITDDTLLLENGITLKSHIFIQNPMTLFNEALFIEGSRVQTFQKDWLPQETPQKSETPICFSNPPITELAIEELIQFHRDPARFFCLKHFNLQFWDQIESDYQDDEPFTDPQDSLDRYLLQDEILKHLLSIAQHEKDIEQYAQTTLFEAYLLQGKLPKYAFAEIAWKKIITPLIPLVTAVSPYLSLYKTHLRINLPLQKGRSLEGKIRGYDNGTALFVSTGRLNYKRSMELMITHLCHNILHPLGVTTHSFTLNKGEVENISLPPIAKNRAEDFIMELIDLMEFGLKTPLLWIEDEKYYSSIIKILDKSISLPEVLSDFEHYKTQISEDESVSNALEILNGYEKSEVLTRLFPTITPDNMFDYLYYFERIHFIIEKIKNPKES